MRSDPSYRTITVLVESLIKIISFAKTNLGLVLLGSAVSVVVLAGLFETLATIHYYRWRTSFDNYGWLGKVTVRSLNPVLMWEYRPYGEFGQIKTNRYGFRDRDYESTAKPENTYRIAFIGDSVTLGMRVSEEETFVRQFEAAANRLEPKHVVQALNFGVDGYNTLQVYEVLRKKALDFTPDKVVYILCLNDFDFDESSGMKILYFRRPTSFLLSSVERVYHNLRGADFHRHHFGKNKKVVFQKLLDMKATLERAVVTFQVVVLPIFPGSATAFANYPLRDMHKEIGEFLRENGIRYLDLLPAFSEQRTPPRSYAFDIWHPNADGHRFIAQKFVGSIL
jgi:lysophospholipase L1-like esterase